MLCSEKYFSTGASNDKLTEWYRAKAKAQGAKVLLRILLHTKGTVDANIIHGGLTFQLPCRIHTASLSAGRL
jgi:hypothetical protein